jgi:hypothetical protein
MQQQESVASLIPTARDARTGHHSPSALVPMFARRNAKASRRSRVPGERRSARVSGLTFSGDKVPLLCWRNIKSLVANLESRFSDGMRRMPDRKGSKLCAEVPRHTPDWRISSACLRSTWQGESFARPRCIPSLCRSAAAETLPVSTPSRLPCAVALRLIEVRR